MRERPANGAVSLDGTVLVADVNGKTFIHHYATDGDCLGSFGDDGSESGKPSGPHGLISLARGSPTPERFQFFSVLQCVSELFCDIFLGGGPSPADCHESG